jgi:hypothetical protein
MTIIAARVRNFRIKASRGFAQRVIATRDGKGRPKGRLTVPATGLEARRRRQQVVRTGYVSLSGPGDARRKSSEHGRP